MKSGDCVMENSGTDRKSAAPLGGVRALIVEDEYLLALLLEDELRAAGCSIADTVGGLEGARQAASRADFNVALLDINLSGELVYPFADELAERGIAFVFLSGYAVGNFPERFRSRPRVAKPYEIGELIREISRSLGKS
jgi:CheY-like chemotaxis protein